MGIWGKMFGGVAGFVVGGPYGAIMGAALGHAADRGSLLNAPAGGWGENWATKGRPDPNGAAFMAAAKVANVLGKREQVYAIGGVALSAKLAKIDAPVNRQEIAAFKRCFQIPETNAREVGRLFDQARQRTDDFEMYGRELGQAYADDQRPLEDLLVALFAIARADSPAPDRELHPRETDFLTRLHRAMGLPPGAWDRAEAGGARPTVNDADAYLVLGLTRKATDQEVRARWRELVRAHHPDVLARTTPTEAQIAAAQDRIGRINAAWDRIKRDRRL